MTDLKTIMESGMQRLSSVHAKVTIAATLQTSVPNSCYQLWQKRSSMYTQLGSTLELLPMRVASKQVIETIVAPGNIADQSNNIVRFNGHKMPFATARQLALSSYITANWTIYDRLSNICGRLIGPKGTGNNPLATSNPKLIEHFLRENKDKRNQHGFSLACFLSPAYGWPSTVSYIIRNWLIHEGLDAGGVVLFKGNTLSDAFKLSVPAMDRIQKACDNDGFPRSKCCFSTETNHPWYDTSLLTILDKCHNEIDEMFCALLKWAIGSFEMQVDLFSMRDRDLIISSTTTTTTAP